MSGTLLIIAIIAALLILGLFLFSKRKGGPASPGSKRDPAQGSPVLKTINHQLIDELQLPSKEFRQELGVRYPELAMAFRQSVNFGITRYTQEFWQTAPSESLIPDIINRILCDYYGFILPRNFNVQELQNALSQYFKQKKILKKAMLDESGASLVITEKDAVIGTLGPLPANESDKVTALTSFLDSLFDGQTLYRLRETERELGFALITPDIYSSLRRFERTGATV